MNLNEELMKAAKKGDTKTVELLIQKGVEVDAKNNDGETVLMLAAGNGYTEMVELLIQKEANVNVKNCYDYTALMLAVYNGHKETVGLLIKKGADVNAKDNTGDTALTWAASYGHTEIVELLIQKGADANAKDEYKQTALMYAVGNGHTETVKLLIQKGADIVYACREYWTRKKINQIAEEKPELFTKEQKLMFDLYSNPRNILQNKKKEVIKVLREFQKKGSISKTESLELFTNLQRIWNKKILITNNEMKKPQKKPDKNKIRKALN